MPLIYRAPLSPNTGGLSTRELLHFIQSIPTEMDIIGADLVEYNPTRDPLYAAPTILGRRPVGPTAMVAAKVAKELVARLLSAPATS